MGESGVVKKGKKKEVVKEAQQPVVLKLRLFVGGLGPSVGAADLRQRFAPLGTVHKIDLVEGKKGWDAADAAQRGFAYVDFEATSEASLRKLLSAYNGCKWKGGVLRVEKAKEHYTDRLRREWAQAEAEAEAKAKLPAAKVAPVAPAREMYSFTPDYEITGSRSPENHKQSGADEMAVDADVMAVDADLVAAQIETERRGHIDLLSKLFPADKDAVDEEEKIVEIVKLRAYPLPDANAKKRKNASEIASSSAPPNEVDDSGVAGAQDTNDRQKTKTRRVKFSEETMDDEKVELQKGSTKPILKKAREDSKKMDVDEEEEEEEEEEYYLPSRSPSPEGGLSDESKWQRLFKYAGPEVAKPSSTGLFTGINLDDESEEEPAVAAAVVASPQRGDGIFSGVLSEEEDEEPQQRTLGSKAADSVMSEKSKKKRKTSVTTDGVGSDGIFSGILSDPEEEEEQDSVAATEEPELNPDQSEEPSEFEDANEDLQDTESSEEEEDEEDDEEEEDEEDDDDDFVDAAFALKSLTPMPLSDAARASKWASMFKSATTDVETVDGAFSGSLDNVDVPARVKEQRMFEAAAADQSIEVPTASDNLVASVEEAAIRQSPEAEDASTSSEDDVAETENKHVTEDAIDMEQTGGNLMTRFNMVEDEVKPPSVDPTPVDENTKWMQRASWKSLMGADGRAAFSLKQVTGESEAPPKADEKKKEAAPATFSFNFARNAAPEATTSTRVNTKPVPKPVVDKPAAKAAADDEEAGCSFMKSANADKEWRASKNDLRIDSKAKHKAAVRKMKKMKGSGGAR